MKKIFRSLFAVVALSFGLCASAMASTGIDAPGFVQATATIAAPQPGALGVALAQPSNPGILASTTSVLAQRMPAAGAQVVESMTTLISAQLAGTYADQEAEGRSREYQVII